MKLIEIKNDHIIFSGLPQLPRHDLLLNGIPVRDPGLSDRYSLSDVKANKKFFTQNCIYYHILMFCFAVGNVPVLNFIDPHE